MERTVLRASGAALRRGSEPEPLGENMHGAIVFSEAENVKLQIQLQIQAFQDFWGTEVATRSFSRGCRHRRQRTSS